MAVHAPGRVVLGGVVMTASRSGYPQIDFMVQVAAKGG